MGDSLDFLGIDLYLVVSYYTTNCIPISLTVSIFPDSPIPRFPDSLFYYPGQAGSPLKNACYDPLSDFERKSLDDDFDL